MKALITGINGFVGPHLKQHLINNGFEVFGTDISNGELVDYSVDLLDKQAVYDLISKITPDFIFHLAAQSSVKLSFIKSELTREINVTGTKNLLDAVKSLIPDSKILVVGSADVLHPGRTCCANQGKCEGTFDGRTEWGSSDVCQRSIKRNNHRVGD